MSNEIISAPRPRIAISMSHAICASVVPGSIVGATSSIASSAISMALVSSASSCASFVSRRRATTSVVATNSGLRGASPSSSAFSSAVCARTVTSSLSKPIRVAPSSAASSGNQSSDPLMRCMRKSVACASACSV